MGGGRGDVVKKTGGKALETRHDHLSFEMGSQAAAVRPFSPCSHVEHVVSFVVNVIAVTRRQKLPSLWWPPASLQRTTNGRVKATLAQQNIPSR